MRSARERDSFMNYSKKKLTPKQKLYLCEIASGKNTYQVAHEYVVSQHTVRNTMAKAKERVGAISTTHLVAMSIVNGWIKPNLETDPLEFVPNE